MVHGGWRYGLGFDGCWGSVGEMLLGRGCLGTQFQYHISSAHNGEIHLSECRSTSVRYRSKSLLLPLLSRRESANVLQSQHSEHSQIVPQPSRSQAILLSP